MAHRYSTLWGLAALGLVAVTGIPGVASASESRQAHASLRQRSTSTAVGVGGDAFASATNRSRTGVGGGSTSSGAPGASLRTDRKPEIDTAVAAAVSVGGKSKAVASNNGPVLPDSPEPGAAKPLNLSDGRVPNTSSAVSVAVTIGGVPIRERK